MIDGLKKLHLAQSRGFAASNGLDERGSRLKVHGFGIFLLWALHRVTCTFFTLFVPLDLRMYELCHDLQTLDDPW